jgi:hypothetical protein
MATPVVLTTGARPIVPVESGGVPMTPVDTLGEPVTVVDTLGEPVVLINNDGTPAFLAYSAKTYLGGVAPYHWLDFINNRALYAGADVGNVTQATGYSFTRASDGYYTNSDGTLTNFGSGALRRGDRGVLIEGSRTNLCLQSQTLDNATWSRIGSTVTANAIAAPDATTTADKLVEDTSTGAHIAFQAISFVSGTTYTASIYAKAGERTRLNIICVTGFLVNASFDLANGTILGTPTGTALIETLANGWYRCSVSIAAAATAAGNLQFRLIDTGTNTSYTGDGTSGLYLWQADLQAGAFPSSPIVTVAASATRAADVLTYTAGVSYGLSLWAEFEPNVVAANQSILFASDGTSNNEAAIRLNAGITPTYFSMSGGALQSNVSVGTAAANTVYKFAARFATDSVRGVFAGTLGTADTSATNPATPTVLNVGSSRAGTEQLFGLIRRIAVFNSALTDAQLQTTTT